MPKPLAALLAALAVLAAFGASAAEAPAHDWSGAYVGLSIGGVALGGTAATDPTEAPAATTPLDARLQPQLGISAGYNVMLNDFLLFGLEGDASRPLPAP